MLYTLSVCTLEIPVLVKCDFHQGQTNEFRLKKGLYDLKTKNFKKWHSI